MIIKLMLYRYISETVSLYTTLYYGDLKNYMFWLCKITHHQASYFRSTERRNYIAVAIHLMIKVMGEISSLCICRTTFRKHCYNM